MINCYACARRNAIIRVYTPRSHLSPYIAFALIKQAQAPASRSSWKPEWTLRNIVTTARLLSTGGHCSFKKARARHEINLNNYVQSAIICEMHSSSHKLVCLTRIQLFDYSTRTWHLFDVIHAIDGRVTFNFNDENQIIQLSII